MHHPVKNILSVTARDLFSDSLQSIKKTRNYTGNQERGCNSQGDQQVDYLHVFQRFY